MGYYYSSINKKWREGYHFEVPGGRNHVPNPALSNVVVISISGGINDYQVSLCLVFPISRDSVGLLKFLRWSLCDLSWFD